MKKLSIEKILQNEIDKKNKPIDEKYLKYDIKILTPYYNMIEPKVENAIYRLLDSKELNCAWLASRGTAIAYVRNTLVNDNKSDLEYQKLEGDFTHYLFIDSDTIVCEDTVKKLLSYDVDIVSGAYISRESEYCYVGGHFKYNKNNEISDFINIDNNTKGLLEVDWVGAGCLLIKKDVFEKLPFPWFHYPIIEKLNNNVKHRQLVFEDVGFSMLAKKHGYKIYLDCDVKVEHLARNYQREHTTNFELLFNNVNDDVNKMCQLMRMMSYRIIDLEKKIKKDK